MIRKLFFVLLVFGLGACGGDGASTTGPDDTEPESVTAGTYTLQSIDGEPLPVVIDQIGTYTLEFTAASITLNADLTCSDSFSIRETESGVVTTATVPDICTYTINAGAISVTYPSDGIVVGGSIVGSQLTLSDDGLVLIFQK